MRAETLETVPAMRRLVMSLLAFVASVFSYLLIGSEMSNRAESSRMIANCEQDTISECRIIDTLAVRDG